MKTRKDDRKASARIDMSEEAIDRRLQDLGQLYELGMHLREARWIGPLHGREGESTGDRAAPEPGAPAGA